jgi:hypothetical protein
VTGLGTARLARVRDPYPSRLTRSAPWMCSAHATPSHSGNVIINVTAVGVAVGLVGLTVGRMVGLSVGSRVGLAVVGCLVCVIVGVIVGGGEVPSRHSQSPQ